MFDVPLRIQGHMMPSGIWWDDDRVGEEEEVPKHVTCALPKAA